MRLAGAVFTLLFILPVAGCSFRSESLSRDGFHGTIKYAVIQSGDSGPVDGFDGWIGLAKTPVEH